MIETEKKADIQRKTRTSFVFGIFLLFVLFIIFICFLLLFCFFLMFILLFYYYLMYIALVVLFSLDEAKPTITTIVRSWLVQVDVDERMAQSPTATITSCTTAMNDLRRNFMN